MVEIHDKCFNVKDFVSMYSSEERITDFCWKIRLPNIGHKDDMILESCSKEGRANMASLDYMYYPYFYLHLYVIQDLRILILFTLFELELLVTANIISS